MEGSVVPDTTTAAGAGAAAGAAGVISWKALSAAAAGGAGLAAIIVMLMTQPRSAREWAMSLISTVVVSIAGGAAVIMKLGLQEWLQSYVGLVAVLGLVFACGLPAWAIVRWFFTWQEKHEGKGIDEVIQDVKGMFKS